MNKLTITTVHKFELLYNDRKSGGNHNGSYYRPIPPEGYYSIGDYGQPDYSLPSPSITIIAVKPLEEGALARPTDYTEIWTDKGSGARMNGSFWLPVPPVGYKAVGTVAQNGHGKPPLDAIMCIREDLLLPAEIGKMVWTDSGTGADHDFGSWQITSSNEKAKLSGSFVGTNSHRPPVNAKNLFCINKDFIEKPSTLLSIVSVQDFELLYNDRKSGGDHDGSYYRPIAPDGYYTIGDYGQGNYRSPAPFGCAIAVKPLEDGVLARPTDYTKIWTDKGSGARMNGSFWLPVPPAGYKAVGTVAQNGHDKPSLDRIMCVREDLVLVGKIGDMIWTDSGTGADHDFGSWKITCPNEDAILANTFIGVPSHSPSDSGGNLFCINAVYTKLEQTKMPQIRNLNFIQSMKKISFTKNGCPLHYHSCYGNRWQHLQDMIRLPDANGMQYYMGTFSQNCSDGEGGLVFVGEVSPQETKGKVIWWEELNNKHKAGGFNHPGDIRRVGDTVIIAGQNWDKSWPFCDPLNMGNGGQAILFYDVSQPNNPVYKGKVNSCWDFNTNKEVSGDIDMVTASYSGEYYYLAFNGLKCRAKSFTPYASWQLVQKGNDGSPSPVSFTNGGTQIIGDAATENGKLTYRKINYSPDPNRLNRTTNAVSRENIHTVSYPKSSFSDGVTSSLSLLADGTGQIVYANVESDDYMEIELIQGEN